MTKRTRTAKEQKQKWQTMLIEDAEIEIKLIVRNGTMQNRTFKELEPMILAVVQSTAQELEPISLKEKAKVSLMRFAYDQYAKMRKSLAGMPLSPILMLATYAIMQGKTVAKDSARQYAKELSRIPYLIARGVNADKAYQVLTNKYSTPIRNLAMGSKQSQNNGSLSYGAQDKLDDTPIEYVEMAQPMREYSQEYQKRVKRAMDELIDSNAMDNYSSRVSLRNIAEMTVRYEDKQRQLAELKGSGVKLVWTSTHANCSERCEPYQGKLYSLDGTSGTQDGYKYVPLEKAMDIYQITKSGKRYSNGIISGYNCRHFLIPYNDGNRPIHVSKETIAKYRKIDAEQRNMERTIRHYRTKAAVYQDIDPIVAKKARAKSREWNSKYKEYSKSNSVAYYPSRVKIYDIDKELYRQKINKD